MSLRIGSSRNKIIIQQQKDIVVLQNQTHQNIRKTEIQIPHSHFLLESCFRQFNELGYERNEKEYFSLKRILEKHLLPDEPQLKKVIDLFEQGRVRHISYMYTTDIHNRPNSPFILSIEHGDILPDWKKWEPNKIPDHKTMVNNFSYALNTCQNLKVFSSVLSSGDKKASDVLLNKPEFKSFIDFVYNNLFFPGLTIEVLKGDRFYGIYDNCNGLYFWHPSSTANDWNPLCSPKRTKAIDHDWHAQPVLKLGGSIIRSFSDTGSSLDLKDTDFQHLDTLTLADDGFIDVGY